ncbi:MAG: hypothetical protein LBS33_04890 [Streptococcaceae bacterium]|jgi:Tfp pilus assembly protein PilP|nr:hypothetical protein [Streptococcaceae bacterium]
MKTKYLVKVVVCLSSLLLLVACGGKKEDTSHSSQSKSAKKQSVSKSSSSASSEEPVQKSQVYADLLNVFTGESLPSNVFPPNNQQISAAYTTPHSQSYQLNYYEVSTALPLNDSSLASATPFATFKKDEVASSDEAIQAVGYQESGGQALALHHGITGYQQGAAGSTYLGWKEGRWSLVVQVTNGTDQNAETVANNIIDLLDTVYLPAPSDVGQITIHVGSSNTLSYNEGNIVYTLTHQDYLSLLKMAASQ